MSWRSSLKRQIVLQSLSSLSSCAGLPRVHLVGAFWVSDAKGDAKALLVAPEHMMRCNRRLVDLIERVKPEIRTLIEKCNTVRLYGLLYLELVWYWYQYRKLLRSCLKCNIGEYSSLCAVNHSTSLPFEKWQGFAFLHVNKLPFLCWLIWICKLSQPRQTMASYGPFGFWQTSNALTVSSCCGCQVG